MLPYHNGKQLVCRCGAYPFPHRYAGGECNGFAIAANCWDNRAQCRHCIAFGQSGCDVMNGTESPAQCPAVQDFNHDYQVRMKK